MAESTDMASHEEQSANADSETKKVKTSTIVVAVILSILLLAGGCYWYMNYQVPHNEAVEKYETATAALDARTDELNSAISDLQDCVANGGRPLDETVIEVANNVLKDAQGMREVAPEMPKETDAINASAKEVDEMGDYSEILEKIAAAKTDLVNSIAQYKQVTCPSEQFVIERLSGLPNVVGIEAVTEGNDPNGNLNKAGGYTATVYFSSDLVDKSELYLTNEYTPIVEAGCDGGGAVEVYQNVEDVEARDTYLGAFDGSILASGSHRVLGTCLIRTSDYLTASQQKALEEAIVKSMIRLES